MNILVTGAAGFVGFFVAKKLLEMNHQVVGLDNCNDYYDVTLKTDRLKLLEHENFRFFKVSLEDKTAIYEIFAKENFDIVINLAAQAGVRHSISNPDIYVQSNILGFHNILEACRNFKLKKLVYASSSSVYGNSDVVPFSVDQRTDAPISLYAATKKSNELMASTYAHLYQMPIVGLRFFTVYGPWGRPDMAPFLFTKAILDQEEIKIFNNGNLERDFTYIDDIVEGVVRVTMKDDLKPEHKLFNIGNGSPTKLLDFISCIEKNIGIVAKKKFLPMQMGDVYKTYADTTELEDYINFKPSTTLDQGIRKFIEWYKCYYL